ncbi:HEAT repeat domain-containing protein, partial [bacterium]|nr:HEAT repeat domain-containing protein [bacterium]
MAILSTLLFFSIFSFGFLELAALFLFRSSTFAHHLSMFPALSICPLCVLVSAVLSLLPFCVLVSVVLSLLSFCVLVSLLLPLFVFYVQLFSCFLELGKLMSGLVEDIAQFLGNFAAIAVGRIGDSTALPSILEMIKFNGNNDPVLRHAGVMALVGIATEQEIADLIRHESEAVRHAAVIS